MKEKKSNPFLEIGIILNIFAVSISVVLKEVLKDNNSNITFIAFILSFILTINWKNVISNCKINFSKEMIVLLFLQIYIVILAFAKSTPMFGSSDAIIYTLYVIAYLYAISTNTRQLDTQLFIKLYVAIASIINILLFVVIIFAQSDLFSMRISVMDHGGNRVTLANVGLIYLYAFFIYKSKNKIINGFMWIVFIVSIYNICVCNRRIVYIATIFCLLFYIWKEFHWKISKNKIIRLLLFIIIFIIIINILSSVSWINNMFSRSFNSLINGISTFFNPEINDASVTIRNNNRNLAISDYLDNNLWQFLFGKGYAYFWIDLPLFEAFLDLGFFAGLSYFYLTFYLVVKKLVSKKHFTPVEYIIAFNAIFVLLCGFSSGMPYGYTKYCPIIIFLYCFSNDKSNKPLFGK